MNLTTLRKHWQQRPFRSFEIELSNGQVHLIDDPDCFWIPPGRSSSVYVADRRGLREIVNPAYIVDVRLAKGRQTSNRTVRRRKAG